ncbi:MAG: glycosyltransferase family 2 protein [Aquaticitalea sp.]
MIQVSVILPVYNGAETLSNTLDSLVKQTYVDFEIIACIDGSTDNSEDILNRYAHKFKKFTILKNKSNRGLGPTMNRMLHNADGEYIAVAEQDDYYYPDRLQRQVDILETDHTIGMVSGIAEMWNGVKVGGKFPGILANGHQYPQGIEMFLLNYKNQIKVVNTCMMFRKSVHIENGLYFTQHYPNVSVDWTYVLRFCLVSNIHGINEVLVRLDRRPDRNSITSNKIKQFQATRELLRSFYYEYPEIISDQDYKYAVRSQNLMEISSKTGFSYVGLCLYYFLKNPFDKRYLENMKKRLLVKKKIYFN